MVIIHSFRSYLPFYHYTNPLSLASTVNTIITITNVIIVATKPRDINANSFKIFIMIFPLTIIYHHLFYIYHYYSSAKTAPNIHNVQFSAKADHCLYTVFVEALPYLNLHHLTIHSLTTPHHKLP